MAAATTIGAIALALLAPASSLADSEATTNPATSITFTSAVLNGVANPSSSDAVYTFQYGTTTAYGQSTPPKRASSGPHDVSETITQLNPATTYHFRLVVADNSYGTTYHLGQDLTFTTPALNAVATTGSATSVTNQTALLNGVVNTTNPHSAWAFQYGTTSSYGQATAPQAVGAGVTAVSAQVSGLKPHTTYHFRLVVVQGNPGIGSAGADVKFRTSAHPFGVVSLRKTKLRVRHGHLSVPLKCSGPRGAVCQGKLLVKVATAKGKSLRCISGRFSVKAGKKFKVRRHVRRRCLALVTHANGHRAPATLSATFSGNQSGLQVSVVLFE